MRITNSLVLLFSVAALFFLAPTAAAQIKPGKYQIVGSLYNGSGFHGKVNIKEAGPVSVKLNNGYTLKGRVDAKGSFEVTSVRSNRGSITAWGSVSMRNRSYAISSGFRVRGEGKGIFMMGRI
jgi:hypothetical protein